jgi:hypothetical protein
MKVSASFPLFGVGLGSFGSVFPLFRSTGEGTALAHAHSDVIELAVETGAAGTLLFVLGAALTFRSLARRSPDARPGPLGYAAAAGVLALTLHSLTDFNLAIPANALTFSVLAGLVLAWRRGTAPAPAARIDRAPGIAGGRPISAFAPAIALVLAAVAGAGGIVTATEAKGRTGFPIERILDAGDAGRIFSRASAAAAPALADLKVLTESAAAGSVPAKVTIDYVRKRIESALAIQESGLRCLPTSSSGHLERGRLLAALCSIDAITLEPSGACALRTANEFRAALRLNPMSASAHAQVARFYVTAWPALGGAMRIEAGTMIERAVELNPFDDRLRADWLAVKGEAPAGS